MLSTFLYRSDLKVSAKVPKTRLYFEIEQMNLKFNNAGGRRVRAGPFD